LTFVLTLDLTTVKVDPIFTRVTSEYFVYISDGGRTQIGNKVNQAHPRSTLCVLTTTMDPSGTSTTATMVMSQRALEVPKLVGQENVFLWRRRVKAALKAREVWAAVAAASTGADNDKAVGLIVASLSDQVLCMLSEEDSAHAMWNELSALYEKRDVGRIILVEEQIFGTKMSQAETAESHIARMNQLFAKLAGAGGNLSDAHKARQMLRSLDG